MARVPPFLEEPADTREAIMRATYLALAEHGYAELTIQRIGDEFEKSKSLLYHHYEGKDDLLLDFLEFMLERFEAAIPVAEDAGADERLAAVLDHVVLGPDDGVRDGFFRAMVELRAQAAHEPAYRDHFTRSDRYFRERLADLVRTGIEEGAFRAVDPEATATLLHTAILGGMSRRATAEGEAAEALRSELGVYVEARLLAE